MKNDTYWYRSLTHYTNVNNMSVDLLHGAMPIQDSYIKDGLIDKLELYGAIPMQDSSIKDKLVLRRSSSKIQYSSLKDELLLRHSPLKFIDGHCNISLICACFLLINT